MARPCEQQISLRGRPGAAAAVFRDSSCNLRTLIPENQHLDVLLLLSICTPRYTWTSVFFCARSPLRSGPVKPSVGVGVGKTAHIVWGGQLFVIITAFEKRKGKGAFRFCFGFVLRKRTILGTRTVESNPGGIGLIY